jgi:hypothetical protein
MPDNIRYDQNDAFEKSVRRKLEAHRLPVGDDGWAVIEQALNRKKKSKLIRFLIIGAVAAASAAILLITVFSGTDDDIRNYFPESGMASAIQEMEVLSANNFSDDISDDSASRQAIKEKKETDIFVSAKTDALTPVFAKKPSSSPADGRGESAETVTVETVAMPVDVKPETDTVIVHIPENAVTLTEEEAIALLKEILDEEFPDDASPGKKKSKWILAATLGTAGNITGMLDQSSPPEYQMDASFGSNHIYSQLSSSIKSFEGMSSGDFSAITHRSPFSTGITVRKKIGRFCAFESGLIYTYLLSEFEWTDRQHYAARQKLHYLGVPLNFILYLNEGKSSKWKIFLSAGTMPEKGLRAIYIQKVNRSDGSQTTDVRTVVPGVQWSLNSGLGINYRFDSGFGIYFEPRLSHHFKNNHPLNVRTEYPLSIGFHTGINYEF